jgi:DNA-binding transcriptional ArsR family regulator
LRRAFGGKFDSNSYDNVTMNLGPLHQWAQQNGVCVLAVTHTRKAAKDVNPDSDPFELVSGSSAISSVADATLLLRRPRGVDASTLTVTGRSIAESTYNLKFDASLLCWQLADKQESLEVLTLPFALKRIYDAIANGANSVGVLANNLGLDKGNVSKWVTKLLDLGLVSKKQLGKNILLSVVFDTTNTTNTTNTTDTTDTTIDRNVNAITNNDSCMDSCMDSCTTVVPEYNYQYNHNKPVLDDKTQDLPKTVVSVVSVVSNQHNHTDTTVVHADNLDNSDNLDNHAQPTIEIPSDAIALRNKADLDLLGQLHGGASKVVEMIVVDSDGTRLISLRDDDSTSKVMRLQGTLKRAMKCNGIVYARL